MQLCWEHEPNNRPNMSQVVQWAETIEFDSLRVDSNLVEVTAISTTCVGRIDPSFEDNHFSHSDTAFELLASQAIGQGSLSVSLMSSASVASEGIETSLIQPRTGRDGMGEMYRRVGAMDEAHTLSRDSGINSTTSSDISGCTQTWLCGRDKRKGLVTIFTYQDNVPGYSVSCSLYSVNSSSCIYMLICTQRIDCCRITTLFYNWICKTRRNCTCLILQQRRYSRTRIARCLIY